MSATFAKLRRAAKTATEDTAGPKVAVVGDVATQLFGVALQGALALRGLRGLFFEADFNQTERQLLAKDSELRAFAPEFTVVWESVERWWARGEEAETRLARVRAYAETFPGKLLYANAAPFADGVFGNLAVADSFPVQVRRFNAGLDVLAAELPNLYVVDLASLVAELGRAQACDPALDANADMPLTLDAQAAFAERVAEVIAALRGQVRKCVVVDLDNTLWGGILGEDGVNGIAIGGHGVGAAHLALQRWLKRLSKRGILLAVCSKNDEPLAREAFVARASEMAVGVDDFVCFVANWENKADNIASIRRVLNLGLDSFVFLDDNPAERALVRQALPAVCVPELPDDPALWLPFLAGLNLFETASHSEADAKRTEQYRVEAQRVAFQSSFADEAGFLRGLEMVGSATPIDAMNLARAAQLTQRSNQFNLRTRRYDEAALAAVANDPGWITLAITLRDRFGDNGLISVLLAQVDGENAFIDTWLMSCRVLKRGVERYALNHLAVAAKAKGAKRLIGEYLPTKKNGLVAKLYPELGFTPLGDNRYALDLATFQPLETHVHENA